MNDYKEYRDRITRIVLNKCCEPLLVEPADRGVWQTDKPGNYTCLYMPKHLYYPKEGSTTITGRN